MNDDPVRLDAFDDLLSGSRKPKKEEKRNDTESIPDVVEVGKCVKVYTRGAKALDIEIGSKPIDSMQYAHICHHSQFSITKDGQVFWFIFGTEDKHKVTVEGRRLRDVYNRINDHCVRTIRAYDRNIDPGDENPFIWRIVVEPLPKEEKGNRG